MRWDDEGWSGSDCDSVGGVGAGRLGLSGDLDHLAALQAEELGYGVDQEDLGQLGFLDFAG